MRPNGTASQDLDEIEFLGSDLEGWVDLTRYDKLQMCFYEHFPMLLGMRELKKLVV